MGKRPPARAHARPNRDEIEGADTLFNEFDDVRALLDDGYRGLARDHPARPNCPPRKPGKKAIDNETAAWRRARKHQSSQRIAAERTVGELKEVETAATLDRLP